jgi:cytidylate kinase
MSHGFDSNQRLDGLVECGDSVSRRSEQRASDQRRSLHVPDTDEFVITIDGPAGTGKSSVARRVAATLGYDFLDTGAMYRAIGLAALRRGCDMGSAMELAHAAKHARLQIDYSQSPPHILLDGVNVTRLLRASEVDEAASRVAVVEDIRTMLVEFQREIGRKRKKLVTEGRDQGTVVFGSARLKVFLTATEEERVRRRARQLRNRGEAVDENELRRQMDERDHRDRTRAVAPLAAAADAVIVDTTGLSEDEVVGRITTLARERGG